MRNRFFFIILATLAIAAAGVHWIENYFFKQQRLELIDSQIVQSSDALLASDEIRFAARSSKNLEDLISRVLGSGRIGKIFLLRDSDGKILYQSTNMSVIQADLPFEGSWAALEANDQYIRLLSSTIDENRILQVGMVLNKNFVNWSIVNRDTIIFTSALVIGLFVIAVLLTVVLLSPIRFLSDHLSKATADLSNLKDVHQLPSRLLKFSRGFWSRSDEFSLLVSTVERLISRINRNYKLTRSWTFQMAHELKTPLAIIRAETESELASGELKERYAQTVLTEVDWTSETITQFLSWAELENSRPHRTLHVVKAGTAVRAACERLGRLSGQKLNIEVATDFSVAASSGHLDQLVTNLLSNACKYSPSDSEIDVVVDSRSLSVCDRGGGIPHEVLERLGEPFNVGNTESTRKLKGNGLGLAWVKTVSKLYDWRLEIEATVSGTRVTVRFPELN